METLFLHNISQGLVLGCIHSCISLLALMLDQHNQDNQDNQLMSLQALHNKLGNTYNLTHSVKRPGVTQ